MSINAICPLPTALTQIPEQVCAINFDQILKQYFQRGQSSAPFDSANVITDKANWDTFISASDSTKIIESPQSTGLTIPNSEGKFEGGSDNTTPEGLPLLVGEDNVVVEGMYRGLGVAEKAALRLLAGESIAYVTSNVLTVFLVNKDGQIICRNPGGVADEYAGITIYNYRIGSVGSEGLDAINMTSFSFSLKSEWDQDVVVVDVDFDPLQFLAS